MDACREALDTNAPFPAGLSPHVYARCLLGLLRSLAQPVVVNVSLPSAGLEGEALSSWCTGFLQTLPPLHHNVFVYVVSFLRQLLSASSANGSTPDVLGQCSVHPPARTQPPSPPSPPTSASVFGPVLVRISPPAAHIVHSSSASASPRAVAAAESSGGGGGGGGGEGATGGDVVVASVGEGQERVMLAIQGVMSFLLTC